MENIPTPNDVEEFLRRHEGQSWDDLDARDKARAIELVATAAELSPESAARLREIVPPVEELNDEDRKLYTETLKRVGLMREGE
jgi:hypothetical protein